MVFKYPVFFTLGGKKLTLRRSRELFANSFLLSTPIKFPFPSDQIFLSLVPLAAVCSPPRELQSQDLPGMIV